MNLSKGSKLVPSGTLRTRVARGQSLVATATLRADRARLCEVCHTQYIQTHKIALVNTKCTSDPRWATKIRQDAVVAIVLSASARFRKITSLLAADANLQNSLVLNNRGVAHTGVSDKFLSENYPST